MVGSLVNLGRVIVEEDEEGWRWIRRDRERENRGRIQCMYVCVFIDQS